MNSTFFYEIRTIQYVTGKSNANVTKVQYVKYTFNIHHTLMCDKKTVMKKFTYQNTISDKTTREMIVHPRCI